MRLGFCLLFFFFGHCVFAQIYNIEERRIITDTTGWAGRMNLSFAASKFTKSVVTANIGSHIQYKTKSDLYLLLLNYDIINANGENFDNRAYAHLRYNRKLSELVKMEYFFQIQSNALLKVQQRILNGLGPRLRLSNTKKAKSYFAIAYMYEFEVLSESQERNFDHRLSSYFTFTLFPKADLCFSNTTYFQPLLNNLQDYRVSNDSNLQFSITRKIKFTTILTFLYDTEPPNEVPGLNYQVRNGITYNF